MRDVDTILPTICNHDLQCVTYYLYDPKKQTSLKFDSTYKNFHSRECVWQFLQNDVHFVLDEASISCYWSWKQNSPCLVRATCSKWDTHCRISVWVEILQSVYIVCTSLSLHKHIAVCVLCVIYFGQEVRRPDRFTTMVYITEIMIPYDVSQNMRLFVHLGETARWRNPVFHGWLHYDDVILQTVLIPNALLWSYGKTKQNTAVDPWRPSAPW